MDTTLEIVVAVLLLILLVVVVGSIIFGLGGNAGSYLKQVLCFWCG